MIISAVLTTLSTVVPGAPPLIVVSPVGELMAKTPDFTTPPLEILTDSPANVMADRSKMPLAPTVNLLALVEKPYPSNSV